MPSQTRGDVETNYHYRVHFVHMITDILVYGITDPMRFAHESDHTYFWEAVSDNDVIFTVAIAKEYVMTAVPT